MSSKSVLVVLVALGALGALSACTGSPVKGAAQPGATTTTTITTTTAPSRSSAEPTTTTTVLTPTTTSAAPALPFDIEGLVAGAELARATGVPEFAHNLRPVITLMPPGIRGSVASYHGLRSTVDLIVVVEDSGNPVYQQWLNEAMKDGTHDSVICPSFGFCSGGDPAQKGEPGGPDTVTFMVAGVKGTGTVTVRIKLANVADPNYVKVLRDLSKMVNSRLPK